jgi:hypothetical protein
MLEFKNGSVMFLFVLAPALKKKFIASASSLCPTQGPASSRPD